MGVHSFLTWVYTPSVDDGTSYLISITASASTLICVHVAMLSYIKQHSDAWPLMYVHALAVIIGDN